MRLCPKCNGTYEDTLGFCPRDGEVLQEAQESIVGRVLDGKYEVESFIAQGGMGAVYLARHILLGDRVVIKMLRSDMRSNSEWLRRFQREGRAARSFRHPNAVTVYDLSAAGDGLVYLVMEYVEGHTLDRELKERGRFTPAETLEVLEPVADVLNAAHAAGVVHRDLKPENIILGASEGGRIVKVLDLGIAKLKGLPDGQTLDASPLTVAGQVLGTPYYMSPEQWGETPRDGHTEVDGRADVYALGVICFELLAGRKPFGGSTLSEMRREHVSTPRPLLHEVATEVPEGFGLAVARAMSKDRDDRPATAGELIAELRAAIGRRERERETGAGGHAGRAYDTARAPESYATVADASLSAPAGEYDTLALAAHRDTGARRGDALTGASPPTTVTDNQPPPARETETLASHAAALKPLVGQQAQGAGVVQPREQGRAGSRAPLVAGLALVFLVVAGVAGVAGWFVWNRMRAGGPSADTDATRGAEATAEAPRVEALSYWLESFGTSGTESPRRVAEESAELSSGEYFKFHFVPRERGYLYIIGPGGDGNQHTLFLGARGAMQLKTNQVAAGTDFAFPLGKDASLRLGRNRGVEDYTVIFSPTPLVAPAALTQSVPYTLTLAELKELEEFRAAHRDDTLKVNAKTEAGTGARAVAVTVPETRAAARPLIFDIRIEHK